MPPAKQTTPFNIAHVVEFGLYITERNANTSVVASVRCQFCVYFKKEDCNPEKVRKRKKTDAIMSWQGHFRPDLYHHHHMEHILELGKVTMRPHTTKKRNFSTT